MQALARERALESGARIILSDDRDEALEGTDFIDTDVSVSMGEAKEERAKRVRLLAPY